MLTGFTPPYTTTGRSSLLPPPPWHYAGTVLSLAFPVDAAKAASLLPDGFGRAAGRAYGHICEWQATTDGSELLDPVYAQYKEFIFLVEAIRPDGSAAMFCPFIYVDQDISMVRGWLQGWPKKIGSVWMTRSYGLAHPAAVPLGAGARLGATLAVKDRRLAECAVTLNGAEGRRLGFFATPTYGLVGEPTLIGTVESGRKRLARATVASQVAGAFHAGTGELKLYETPRDEIGPLAPTGPAEVSLGTIALTITGATELS